MSAFGGKADIDFLGHDPKRTFSPAENRIGLANCLTQNVAR